jgi:hypothetical protein
MLFVANLRAETIDAFAVEKIQPAAYLLSSHRVTPATLAGAEHVRELGLPLFADNGTKPLIDLTITDFGDAARAIATEVRDIRHALGRSPRGRDIPKALRRAAADLADAVVDVAVARSQAVDTDALIDLQTSMAPTHLMAQEDFATACLIGLGLEREITGWPVSRFAARNRRSLRLWARVASDPRCAGRRVFAVLSAIDFNTAVAAGRLAAEAGVTHAALGFAGINLDRSAVDFYVLGRASLGLERPVPRRYVRLAQIACGLAEGFRQGGGTPAAFHCLGLGAPVMFPIVAAGFDGGTAVTTDATSPIHDAVRDHVLYDAGADGDRASILEIVRRIVAGGDWPFLSPFTVSFRRKFGHDPKAARAWALENGHDTIERAHLSTPSALTRALPLFTDADRDIFAVARKTWIAHNHWVLGLVGERLSGAGRRAAALASLARQVDEAPSLTVTVKGLKAAREVLERTAIPEQERG